MLSDWSSEDWAKWFRAGSRQIHSDDPNVRRNAFDAAMIDADVEARHEGAEAISLRPHDWPRFSPSHSTATAIDRFVRARIGDNQPNRDLGLVQAIRSWTLDDQGAPAFHLLLALMRRWKPIGGDGAVLRLIDDGALRSLAATDEPALKTRQRLTKDLFDSLAVASPLADIRRMERSLRKHLLWDAQAALPCILAKVHAEPEMWLEFVHEHRAEFLGRELRGRSKLEALRRIIGKRELAAFTQDLQRARRRDNEIGETAEAIIEFLQHDAHNIIEFRFDTAGDRYGDTDPPRLARVKSGNYAHQQISVSDGLLYEWFDYAQGRAA